MLRDLQQRQESVKQLPLEAPISKRSYKLPFLIGFLAVVASYFVFYGTEASNKNRDEMRGAKPTIAVQLSGANEINTAVSQSEQAELHQSKADQSKADHSKSSETQSSQSQASLGESYAVYSENNVSNNILTDVVQKKAPQKATIIAETNAEIPINEVEKNLIIKDELRASASYNNEQSKISHLAKQKSVSNAKVSVKKQSPASLLNSQLKAIRDKFNQVGLAETKLALTKLLTENPKFHSARLYLIGIVWSQKTPSTEKILEQAVSKFPRQSAFVLAASRYYLEENQLEKAESYLQKIEGNSQQLTELYQLRGVIRQKQNKHLLAINDYASVLGLTPDRGDIYIALGISLEAINQYKQAHLSYQKATLDSRLSSRQLQFVKNKIQSFNALGDAISDNSQISQGS
jgi:MSHA biogenesis protein MshN